MTNRKLVAVLFTDMVGFSKSMNTDEDHTMELLDEHDKILKATISAFNGTVLKHIGDAVFAEFPLVSDAVNCAQKIQATLSKHNEEKEEKDKILIRIGIHMGEVIERGNDLYGDGVNIAARLEPLASPGGVCLSEDVYRAVKSTIKQQPEYGGSVTLKNISEPMMVYHYHSEGFDATRKNWSEYKNIVLVTVLTLFALGAVTWLAYLPESKNPVETDGTIQYTGAPYNSIAVMAFRNISGNPEREYFSEGMSEEILNLLAHIPSLKVTSRTSSFSFKDKSMKLSEIAKELNVKYILEGSVRESGDTIRITAQLIDTESDIHLWSDTYDSNVSNIFQIQDEISQAIVQELKSKMDIDLKQPKTPVNLPFEVLDHLWQGRYYTEKRTSDSLEQAEFYFKRVTEAAPDFAEGWSGLARVTLWQGQHRYGNKDFELTLKLAEQYANKAYELNPNSDDVLSIKGQLLIDLEQFPAAMKYFHRAIELNPSNSNVLIWMGGYYFNAGEYDKAVEYRQKALSVNPKSSVARFSLILNLLELNRPKEAKAILDRFNPETENELQFLRAKVLYALFTRQYASALYWCEVGRISHPEFIFFTAQYINILADLRKMEQVKAVFDTLNAPLREVQYLYTGDIQSYIETFSTHRDKTEVTPGFEHDSYQAMVQAEKFDLALEIVRGCDCNLEAYVLQKLGQQKQADAIFAKILQELNQNQQNGLADVGMERVRFLIIRGQVEDAVKILKEELQQGYILSSDFYLYKQLEAVREHPQWPVLVELSQQNINLQKKIYQQLIQRDVSKSIK